MCYSIVMASWKLIENIYLNNAQTVVFWKCCSRLYLLSHWPGFMSQKRGGGVPLRQHIDHLYTQRCPQQRGYQEEDKTWCKLWLEWWLNRAHTTTHPPQVRVPTAASKEGSTYRSAQGRRLFDVRSTNCNLCRYSLQS